MSSGHSRPVAIVSGGSAGIGAACSRKLAASGLDVLVNFATNVGGAEKTVAECRSLGADASAVQGDVSDDSLCRVVVAEAVHRWGRIDVLVNNAGTTRFADQSDLSALTKEDFDFIFSVNVVGAYQLTRAACGSLNKSPSASIVNVSSHSAISGIGSSMAYAASKGALNTLTLSLARALAPQIRVNAVCPGFVDTQWMSRKLDDDQLADFKRRVKQVAPLERLVSVDEVAEAVSWFALGGQSITGQFLVIDAGTHLTIGNPL